MAHRAADGQKRGVLLSRTVRKLGQVSTFARSQVSPEAEPAIVRARMAECMACPKLETVDSGRYCGACGCGRWWASELSRKLRRGYLECPLKRPGFSNAEDAAP